MSPVTPSIHVHVVDDDEPMRDSLSWLLESHDMRVSTFATAESYLLVPPDCTRACLLLDVRMPGVSGVQLHETLIARGSTIPIIFLTGHANVAMAVEAIKKGAYHFVEKPFGADALVSLIRQAVQAHDEHERDHQDERSSDSRLASLTPREREVLDMIVLGKLSKTIAATLGISPKTVEGHRAHIKEKLNAGSVAELVRFVVQRRS